jgi:hypothetical protein
VQARIPGDVRLPRFDPAVWREVERRERPAVDENPHALVFRVLERASPQ